jgi:hypothetical protein
MHNVYPEVWVNEFNDDMGFYVFECPSCGKRRAHWDIG